jgi:hypothetical protein
MHLIAPFGQQACDFIAGLMFFEAELRLLMETATQGDKLRFINL